MFNIGQIYFKINLLKFTKYQHFTNPIQGRFLDGFTWLAIFNNLYHARSTLGLCFRYFTNHENEFRPFNHQCLDVNKRIIPCIL